MSYLFFLTAVLGAMGVYLILPHPRSAPRIGAVLALAALGGSLLIWFLPDPEAQPSIYYYLFTLISASAAVRVITHPRPVYSALYFIIVVLSSAGMLVLLDAEFMAFAMIIIYGGAILITYMFVIMLATLPQSAQEPNTAPDYDTRAREPLLCVLMGMALVASLSAAIFQEEGEAGLQPYQPGMVASTTAAADMPRKFSLSELSGILRANELIGDGETVEREDDLSFDPERGVVTVAVSRAETGARTGEVVELDDDVINEFVYNIDYVGLTLFKGHTLGIELAGVVLLLAMVAAIVIARRRVPEAEPAPKDIRPE